jgi:RNA polymerase sigma factor (sigma-70 family)
MLQKGGKGVESVVDWFEEHIQSFYILGWSYLQDEKQMEELFYRSIVKVGKQLSRYKNEISFEMWVTSIFIHTCRELSEDENLLASENSEPRQHIFKALDQLDQEKKEAVVLTYIKGLSHEETSQLLQVSVEKVKELLFSGIQSLRIAMGNASAFNGCKEYHKHYIDYLERTLERPEKVDFEIHIYHCQGCQEDLASFQDVMLTLLNFTERTEDFEVASGFLENVKARLAEKEQIKQQKHQKRKRIGLVFASVFALLVGIEFFTGAFSSVYYAWTEEDQELRAFLQLDLGENLNLEAESNGVKIKIRSVIADDVQTLVFYEIEDTKEDNQYMMNYHDGVLVENENEIMNTGTHPRFIPPDLESDVNKKEKNVFQGKLSLPPLQGDNGTIELKITKLLKIVPPSADSSHIRAYEHQEFGTGEWNFEIPVTKKPSTQYALDEETEVEGIPIRFEQLIFAPTATVLQFSISNVEPNKRIDFLNLDQLEVSDKKLKADQYGSSFADSQPDMNWTAFQTYFDPLFGEKPKKINVPFQYAHLTFDDQKTIQLDASEEYPQTFEYAGSTISIDKVEVGQPSSVVISNHEFENRAYQSLQFQILGEEETEPSSMEMNSEGVLVDKNGKKYDINSTSFNYEEIEQPRHFTTVETVTLRGNNAVPKSLVLYGYNTMKYLDDVVEISVD